MTAVEWLQSQIVFESVDKELLARWDEDSDLSEYFEQAKAMEKEQTIEFASYYTPLTKEELEIGFNHKFKNQQQ